VLEEEGVIVSAGAAYGMSADRYLRMSFAASDEAIEQGILRVGAVARRMLEGE
jgi:aspartate/methionine/tyrosine aminotransferase